MALSRLSGDEQGILFVQLCNVLDPGIAVALSSVNNELARTPNSRRPGPINIAANTQHPALTFALLILRFLAAVQ